jgi:hypothetical protein
MADAQTWDAAQQSRMLDHLLFAKAKTEGITTMFGTAGVALNAAHEFGPEALGVDTTSVVLSSFQNFRSGS